MTAQNRATAHHINVLLTHVYLKLYVASMGNEPAILA